ncbi:hypothetical protein REPUB_Repub09cG0126200 [Reevesia pubescens]
MEERVASSAEGPQPQSSRPDSPERTHNNKNEDNENLSLQLARPPNHLLSTYVVQVPKDQIYRVPPPENARIVESYRKAAKAPLKNKRKPCLKYFICIAIVLFVIFIMIGVTLIVINRSFTPKAPVFSVSKLHVKQHKDGVEDEAKLMFWTKTLGWGAFPSLYQNGGDSNVIHVKVNGHNDQKVPLPPNVQKSTNDKKTKHQIFLVLNFNSPLLLNVWIFKMWSKDLHVKCNFRVSTIGEGTKILIQDCKTKMS